LADTTAITITAIVTTGVASGVIGPAVAARLETRRDERRFRHERTLQDTAEVRAMVDSTGDQLDAVVATFARVISYEHAPHLSLIDAKGIELLDQLEEAIDTLGRSLSRLIVRVGPQSPLAEICRDVIAVAQDIKFELMGIGNSVDLKKDQSEIFRELQPVEEEMSKLKLLRPQYDAVAFETVGVDLEPPEP
jgi:hypothetical protein